MGWVLEGLHQEKARAPEDKIPSRINPKFIEHRDALINHNGLEQLPSDYHGRPFPELPGDDETEQRSQHEVQDTEEVDDQK